MNESIKRILAILILIVIIFTISLSLLDLFEPTLIGLLRTRNGIIEYFRDSLDPSFVIKPYLNGSPVNATIIVLVNQPNKVVFSEKYVGYSLKIPFKSLVRYVKPWENWDNVNSSLLVFVTYSKGNKTFVTPMEIPYSPSWVLNNEPISIVTKIDIIPKVIKMNLTKSEQQIEKIREKILKRKSSYTYCPYCSGGKSYKYIVNATSELLYECGIKPCIGYEAINVTYFYNFSVPLNWVTISNNVNKYDNYTYIYLTTCLVGEVSWYAISTSPPYCLGPSYSADICWSSGIVGNIYNLSKLDNPTLYTYYNATIAVITYLVQEPLRGSPVYKTVFEILSVQNKIGKAIETSNGFTCIVYNNLNSSNGKEHVLLPIGNGTVTYYYNLIPYMNMSLNFIKYGYATWNESTIYVSGNVSIFSETPKIIWFKGHYLANYITNNKVASIAFDGVDLLLTALIPDVGVLADLGLTTIVDIVNYILFGSYTLVESYFSNTHVKIHLPYTGSGQLYISFSNYTTELGAPLDGFMLNYSDYYTG
ncbi:hypothetical protein [Sulfurisphaera tokodaii]|uniref:Uncharacterized protein n=2 Tax=Sulfurisphaera tokodaii TaxID=111955 RepID=Q973V9_SULTO|nr:hypothetical protein [Sulfurisphaera tokodaii]BAB65801.1 hypothetical protein STK_07890 [Sulfurisphaera tokodaii str. 7]HII74610.1 hypothetical protein [Sulfurisphaera tokodaii]